jgi:hypothetical protein
MRQRVLKRRGRLDVAAIREGAAKVRAQIVFWILEDPRSTSAAGMKDFFRENNFALNIPANKTAFVLVKNLGV